MVGGTLHGGDDARWVLKRSASVAVGEGIQRASGSCNRLAMNDDGRRTVAVWRAPRCISVTINHVIIHNRRRKT